MGEEATHNYRALVARANDLAPDRPDIAFSVKELAKRMSAPPEGDRARLKHLGRYLKGRPRTVQLFGWQGRQYKLSIYIDADCA